MKTPAFALLALFSFAPGLLAEGLSLGCRLEPESVTIAARQEVVVTLKNEGAAPVELPKLAFDRQVVSLDVKLGDGPVATYERIHPNPYEPQKDWPKATLGPGESQELRIGLPAIQVGPVSVTAHLFRPHAQGPGDAKSLGEHLTSAPATGTVTPDPQGNDAVELRIITTHGPMRARLFPELAPATCLHICELAMAGPNAEAGTLQPGFYDGKTFHRVIPDFMIQGGDPNGDGSGGPGWCMPGEQPKAPFAERAKHLPGRLSMAKSDNPDSGGSQFFICTGTPSYLDGVHVVFGELTRGLDVAETITMVPTVEAPGGQRTRPLDPVLIKSLSVRATKSPAQK